MYVYDKMRDSKLPWLKEIPTHWRITRMKEILQNVSEKNHPDATVLSLYREHGVLPKDSRDDNHNVTSLDTASYKFVRVGELVINKMKAWQGSLGVSDYEGIVSPAYYVCKFKSNDINKKYFHYLVRCKLYAQEFERLSTGMRVGQWDLSIDDFMATQIIIPPVSEQSAIVAYLDDQISQIDSIIAEAKTSIEEYKQWKASIIFEAVTKGLDPNVEMRNSGTEFGSIPNNWQVIRLKNIAREIFKGNGITKEDIVEDGDTVCVRYGEIYSKYNFCFEHCLTKTNKNRVVTQRYFSYGDILFAGTGELVEEIGKSIVYIGNDVCLAGGDIIVVKHTQNPVFMAYALNSNYIQIQKSRNKAKLKVVHISSADIGSLIVFLPPIEEQYIIADYLKEKCSIIDSIIKEKESLIGDLEQYKRSLIYEFVTGKRKVV